MANEQNEAVCRRALEAFNTGDEAIVEETTAEDFVNHDPAAPDEAHGVEGAKQFIATYRAAFPDLHIEMDDCFSDGDLVGYRWTSTGTNDGELMGMPATGKHVSITGITIDRVQDGKIVESWSQWDNAGLIQQLGLTEAAATAAS